MTSIVKMNAINRLDILLSDILKTEASTSTNGISQGASIQPLSKLTFSECKSYPSSVFSSAIIITVPLPPHRNSSSLKHHHSDQSDKQKQYKPLLNSSTLDDLFRALTLECEQYLAATTSSYQNKTSNQMIIQPPSSKIQASVESNDDDYENLHTLKTSQSITKTYSPLKTSIEVISPIKRHVVSITITSRVSSPPTIKPSCNATTSTIVQATNHHSSDDDAINISSSSTNRKRRRRARKQIVSSSITRSSSSSNERKKIITDKKPIISKRSCSTDPRYQRNKTSYDNDFISCSSSQKQRTKRPYRRDISLQHSLTNSERYYENHSSPLSVLLTSTKITSDDFFDNTHQRQQRRSRFESVNHKPSTLIDRMHQQLYQPSTIRNHHNNNNNNNSNKKNTNIPTHRTPSYPVY
ncbi:unnamed protein product [Rotaria sordida]|uniref:Uncharacterized protein n=2 Tax=Rotaria sordida TaxID=392033 RepID=A0A813SZ28_9BILA|nr:unnamed protein product [Rotaria sordida]